MIENEEQIGYIVAESIDDIYLLRYILEPHFYQDFNNEYGMNNIEDLIVDPTAPIRNWPSLTNCFPHGAAPKFDTMVTYYKNKISDMLAKYIKYTVQNGEMGTYDEIVNSKPLIDLSSSYKPSNKSRHAFPSIKMNDNETNILRKHGMAALMPCYNDLTIKLNRKKYLHVTLLNVTQDSFEVKIEDYSGDKYNWCKQFTCSITFTFNTSSDEKVPCKWDVHDIECYEEFIVKHIPDMKWTQQEIHLWFDVFGVYYTDKISIIKIPPPQILIDEGVISNDEYNDIEHFIFNPQHVKLLKRKYASKLSVTETGETALQKFKAQVNHVSVLHYIKSISAINLILLSTKAVTHDHAEQSKRYQFGEMSIIANTKPITPIERRGYNSP
ncbi:hypothetical protein J6A31_06595 [bacterium]|nr:hypothetical protein [bacterium]